MEPMGLIYTAIGLFSAAALLGLYLLMCVLRQRETPKSIAIAHGVLAASALFLLIFHLVKTGADTVQTVVIFIFAAVAGLLLFMRDLSGRPLPKGLALVHAFLAVTGFVFLLVYTCQK